MPKANQLRADPKAAAARRDALALLGLGASAADSEFEAPKARLERIEQGREVRSKVPRRSFGDWEPAANRPDPIEILEAQAAERVTDLIPIRHGRMVASPFAFFRGAAAVMAWDLGAEPDTGLRVQTCGDAHLANFGGYAAPDRKLVFDLNDFDETLPAPFEWDLKRLVASLELAARDNDFRTKDRRAIVETATDAYQGSIGLLAELRFLDAWYSRIDVERVVMAIEEYGTTEGVEATKRAVDKALRKTSLGALKKLTVNEGGHLRIRETPPLIVRFDAEHHPAAREIIERAIADYTLTLQPDRAELLSRYRMVDFARKVVGVGSVGTEAFIALMMGDREDDPLFLQLKEAKESVLAPFAGASEYGHHGERVVQGQRLMQAASDSLLGWVTGHGPRKLDYYVRQLRDMKGSVDIESMDPERMRRYAELCGATLARAHARAGDAAAISGYVGTGEVLRQSMVEYAAAYADRTELDHALLADAVASGRVEATLGV